MIDLFKPDMGEGEIAAVSEALRSGWTGLGPKTEEFENLFAKFCGVFHAVGLNSCTAALDLSMRLLGVSKGDEVIVPAMTFVSTAHVVAYSGATPVFADVDEKSMCIDLSDVASKITKKTKAVIVVHFAGRPVDMDVLKAICGDIPIIEDCAHAAGSSYKGMPVGGIGDMGCFSFHSVKNLSMGDGGALTTNSLEWAERARRLRWLGIDKDTWSRSERGPYKWEYRVDEVGLKCHMNDISASMGIVQLGRLKEMNWVRKEVSDIYFRELSSFPEIELPPQDGGGFVSSWHIFHLKARNRNGLADFLSSEGISTGVHYTPIHTYGCYSPQKTLPMAECLAGKIISLPIHPLMSGTDALCVAERIKAFYKR